MNLRPWLSRLATGLVGLAAAVVLILNVGPFFLRYSVYEVLSGSMAPGIPTGSEVFDQQVPASTLHAGDVITFEVPTHAGVRVTHRILSIDDSAVPQIITKGDANGAPDAWRLPARGNLERVFLHVPLIGYVQNWLAQPLGRLVMIAALGGLAVVVLREVWDSEEEPDYT